MTTKTTQTSQILEYMRAGNSITPLDALRKFGCMRLGARIYDLKQDGHVINTLMVKDEKSGVRYARYSLASLD
ncbi:MULTISPECIES: helix-turn-helix domain-containing protein [Snodgrassella]|uniref:helix-turn-helix domain-containing protein n=1 Tax=Snodgrassella TaxID=1193515 RepID=UPI000B16CE55|nr:MULTISPECIES: helix-turn-helix domain-containing protein [Snodgrassella]